MSTIVGYARMLGRREHGVTAIEYALIAALIAVVIIAGTAAVGTALGATFTNIAGKF